MIELAKNASVMKVQLFFQFDRINLSPEFGRRLLCGLAFADERPFGQLFVVLGAHERNHQSVQGFKHGVFPCFAKGDIRVSSVPTS